MSSLNGEPVGITAPTDPNKLQDFMLHTVGKLVDKYVKGFMETKGMSVTDTEINSKSSTKTTTVTSRHIAEQDGDTNYASLLMGYGLMAEDMHNAWREGDGARLTRCWKFLLHFRSNGRTK